MSSALARPASTKKALKMTASKTVNIIGGGLAGSEAALYLSARGVSVRLFEAKPSWRSPAHKSADFAEIVCSNSLKSTAETTASGALKNELGVMGCALLNIARQNAVPAGSALAVDRDRFSAAVTDEIRSRENIEIVNRIVRDIDVSEPTLVCAGPVCHDDLAQSLATLTGERSLHFFDAAAPIVTAESIDMSRAFFGARYGKGGDDYLNCPMTKDEYLAFHVQLINAERVVDEIGGVFEGCMPVEVMAARGVDALRFGPLRPVGFRDAGKPYAVLQLRRENCAGTLFNLVGFQTNLKFGEQKRVFSLIPALANAEYLRYGVMHRNTFINSPQCLNADFSLKERPTVFFAGQITGVEGYVESAASGLLAAIHMYQKLNGRQPVIPDSTTVLGALSAHISSAGGDFQPMNANFGILKSLENNIRDKKLRYAALAERALANIKSYKQELL